MRELTQFWANMLPESEIKKLKLIRAELDSFIGSDLPWAKEYLDNNEHFDNLKKHSAELERGLKKYFKSLAGKVTDKIDWEAYDKALNEK